MTSTYRAMQVSPQGSLEGSLELVERPVPAPGEGEVLIAVQACGICGADIADIANADRTLTPPRVPGHEIVGSIVKIGRGVASNWAIGQRVGVGRLGGHCNACPQCRQGKFNLCRRQPFVGSSCDGGYAEMMLARATGLVSIPDELAADEAAPILCAGIATFNALKKCGAEAGDLVAVLGIGGLGHLAVQFASRMGFRTIAIARGTDKEPLARQLGAGHYIDSTAADPAAELQRLGGAKIIVATATSPQAIAATIGGLSVDGRVVVLGADFTQMALNTGALIGKRTGLYGWPSGSSIDSEDTMKFSAMSGVRPMTETFPLEKAQEAYDRMMSNKARFRVVFTTGN